MQKPTNTLKESRENICEICVHTQRRPPNICLNHMWAVSALSIHRPKSNYFELLKMYEIRYANSKESTTRGSGWIRSVEIDLKITKRQWHEMCRKNSRTMAIILRILSYITKWNLPFFDDQIIAITEKTWNSEWVKKKSKLMQEKRFDGISWRFSVIELKWLQNNLQENHARHYCQTS